MMKTVRALLSLIVGLAIMGLAGCGHYNCGITFGASSCTPSGSGLGTTGGTSTTAAFAFAIDTAGTIDGYTLNTTAGTFGPTPSYTGPTVPPSDFGTGMVVAQSQFLYAGFYTAGTLYGWSINPTTGALTAVNGSPYSAPFMGTVPSSLQAMITNPAGTMLFIADASPSEIWVYLIGTDGTLTAVAGSPFSTGTLQPGGLAIDGLGKYLYVTQNFSNHTGSEVGAYSIGSNGALTIVPGSPFAYPMGEVHGEPTGKYLIGTTGNTLSISGVDVDQLWVFGIQQSGANAGAIAPVSGSPFTTTFSPYSLAVQPNASGNLVYSFGLNDADTGYNPVEGYQINPSTGFLTAINGSPFTNAAIGYWGQFDQSGAFLFLYSSVFNSSTGTVTNQLGALDLGTNGVLTEPTSPVTLATQGYWAVTDPK